jgi:hypothetical protein
MMVLCDWTGLGGPAGLASRSGLANLACLAWLAEQTWLAVMFSLDGVAWLTEFFMAFQAAVSVLADLSVHSVLTNLSGRLGIATPLCHGWLAWLNAWAGWPRYCHWLIINSVSSYVGL